MNQFLGNWRKRKWVRKSWIWFILVGTCSQSGCAKYELVPPGKYSRLPNPSEAPLRITLADGTSFTSDWTSINDSTIVIQKITPRYNPHDRPPEPRFEVPLEYVVRIETVQANSGKSLGILVAVMVGLIFATTFVAD
jgi:hypothetical protein